MQASSFHHSRPLRQLGQTQFAEPCTSARCVPRPVPSPSLSRSSRRGTALRAVSADASNLVSTLTDAAWWTAFGLGAAWLASEVFGERKGSSEEACATCGGTGVVDCMCTRWSDHDIGCGSCKGSGKSTCRSCGGGGTRIPIAANLYADADRGHH